MSSQALRVGFYGPPETGKTTTAMRLYLELVEQGQRPMFYQEIIKSYCDAVPGAARAEHYYIREQMEAFWEHICTIAEEIDRPIIVDNHPRQSMYWCNHNNDPEGVKVFEGFADWFDELGFMMVITERFKYE